MKLMISAGLLAMAFALTAPPSNALEFGSQDAGAPFRYALTCKRSRDWRAGVTTSLYKGYAEIETNSATVQGLSNWFCIFQNRENNLGSIDLQTLASSHPSFAATYLLEGIDIDLLMTEYDQSGTELEPGPYYCEKLDGTSISIAAIGGFVTSPFGTDEVCVFPDGSMISIWVLVYVSESGNGDYLSMRKAVRSQPLDLDLPYLRGSL
jgi:hypothetical protein